ncbi:hypothetical protein C0J52_15371, partial [Blattella germanica]
VTKSTNLVQRRFHAYKAVLVWDAKLKETGSLFETVVIMLRKEIKELIQSQENQSEKQVYSSRFITVLFTLLCSKGSVFEHTKYRSHRKSSMLINIRR